MVTGGRLERWEGQTVAQWAREWDLPALHVYPSVDSTNDLARELSRAGHQPGSTVVALHQRAGRGTRGRRWQAEPETSLLLSMVMSPTASEAGPLLSLRLGIAAAGALEGLAPLRVDIKWPNDLMIGGRKVAGILCESTYESGRLRSLVGGIGVNLAQRDDQWPPELRDTATSLASASPERWSGSAAEAAGAVARAWLRVCHDPRATLSADELTELHMRDWLRGKAVSAEGAPAGTAEGVAENGALLVRDHRGVQRLLGGTIRPLENGPRSQSRIIHPVSE